MKHQPLNTVGAVPLADVRATLAMLGLTPWAPEAIAAYMRREKSHYRANAWYYFGKVLPFVRVSDSVPRLILMALGALCGLVFVAFAYVTDYPTPTVWLIGECNLVLFLVLAAVAGTAAWMDQSMRGGWLGTRKVFEPAQWSRNDAYDYTGIKPRVFDETIDKVRSVFPVVSFKVDELKQGDRLLDPVLWAIVPTEDGAQEVAVLVWDNGGVVVSPR
jgi:hypothetical protein